MNERKTTTYTSTQLNHKNLYIEKNKDKPIHA